MRSEWGRWLGSAAQPRQNARMNTPASPDEIRPADGYAGDVSPETAARWLAHGEAVLIDVRTDAEREWVGYVPGAVALAWKQWPGMAMNPDFDAGLRAAVPPGAKAVLLCRSGVRSVAAARRATELGLTAYNILEGFEGDADAEGHRGNRDGWRRRGLPWKQS
jgi:rhodanese-related sulfurtransferase